MRRVWRFIVGLFAVVGVLAVLVVAGLGTGVWWYLTRDDDGAPPPRMVLTVDLREPLPGGAPPGRLRSLFADGPATLHDTIEAIDRAALDPRVTALAGVFGGDVLPLAEAQELRAAIARFRAGGKPAFAYADSFGEFGPGNVSYYLASAFDEIWLAPIGTLGLTGIYAEVPFAAEALDSFGLEPAFARRGPYKTAPESLTERGFSPAHREMVESLTDDLYGQMVAGIAEGRGLSAADTRRLIDDGPYLADAAQAAGLVDRLDGEPAFEAMLAERAGAGPVPEGVAPRAFLKVAAGAPPDDAPAVAVIYADGLIATGDSDDAPLFGMVVMGADTVAGAIDAAVADPGISGIVLRIDSGGGSAVASEIIGRAVARAAGSDKPIVVSMARAAASGGYWIAAPADSIVAAPATLTGSIGVFAGKIVTEGLWEEWGVAWQGVGRGAHADIWSSNTPYSRDEAERVQALVDGIYEQFIARVAAGRRMAPEQVRGIAEGRVWTGAQALELGLVDRLGGLDTALIQIRGALGLAEDAPLRRVSLPRDRGLLDELRGLSDAVAAPHPADILAPGWRDLAPLAIDPAVGTLRMPPLAIGG